MFNQKGDVMYKEKMFEIIKKVVSTHSYYEGKPITIIHKVASDILDNIKDLDPDFSKTVDENFWDLI